MIVILAIKVLFDALYEVLGDPTSTNWVVAYNAINYILYACVFMSTAENLNDNKRKFIANHYAFIYWMCNVFGMLYTSYAMIELTYIGASFETYYNAMAEGYFAVNYLGSIVVAIIFYIIILQLKKKYKWSIIPTL